MGVVAAAVPRPTPPARAPPAPPARPPPPARAAPPPPAVATPIAGPTMITLPFSRRDGKSRGPPPPPPAAHTPLRSGLPSAARGVVGACANNVSGSAVATAQTI